MYFRSICREVYWEYEKWRLLRRSKEINSCLIKRKAKGSAFKFNALSFFDLVKNYIKELTGHALINLLECRLDNLVYRLGFANSIRQARQMVVHGHILVNGKKVDIPSFNVSVGDEIKLREKSQKNVMFKENFESNILNVLPYLSKNEANFSGVLERLPERSEVPIEINEVLVVEYYSKN